MAQVLALQSWPLISSVVQAQAFLWVKALRVQDTRHGRFVEQAPCLQWLAVAMGLSQAQLLQCLVAGIELSRLRE